MLYSPDGTVIKKTFRAFALSKQSMKANFNFKQWPANPTNGVKSKEQMSNFTLKHTVFLGYSYRENKTCSENSMARVFK